MSYRIALILLFGILLSRGPARAADRIILRNLDIISDRTIKSFDLDGVVLDNATTLGWDEIEKATVGDRQAEFDALLSDVGGDLYRLRQRLSVGDYGGLAPHAEALWPRYQDRRSRTAYMVFQSLMWSRLNAGQREEAVEPYLLCVECLRSGPLALPGERKLTWDSATAMSDELVPIWFRPDAARDVLPRVGKIIGAMKQPWPGGVRIYYATLATSAGDAQRANTALTDLPNEKEFVEWRTLIDAQREVEQGNVGSAATKVMAEWSRYEKRNRIAAHYWIGRGLSLSTVKDIQREGLLHLLRLPALYGEEQPEIAAAGLYCAMDVLTKARDASSAVSLRNELLERYGQTTFAEQVRKASEP
jgi:hypothetical protein